MITTQDRMTAIAHKQLNGIRRLSSKSISRKMHNSVMPKHFTALRWWESPEGKSMQGELVRLERGLNIAHQSKDILGEILFKNQIADIKRQIKKLEQSY